MIMSNAQIIYLFSIIKNDASKNIEKIIFIVRFSYFFIPGIKAKKTIIIVGLCVEIMTRNIQNLTTGLDL